MEATAVSDRTTLSECPLIDGSKAQLLAQVGVLTLEDLLNAELMASVPISAREVHEVTTAALQYWGPHRTNMYEVWANEMGPAVLQTGQNDFDALMQGGLLAGKVTEIVGPTATGKTQLCLWLAAQLASAHEENVVVALTSAPTFAPQRLLSFVRGHNKAVLQRIEIVQCGSAEQLTKHLYELRDEYSCAGLGRPGGVRRRRLVAVIVDSVASVLQPCLGRLPLGHSLLFAVRNALSAVCAATNAAAVVTNFTVAAESGEAKAALGPSWAAVASVRLWMMPTRDDDQAVTVTVRGVGSMQRACRMRMSEDALTFSPL